jgi:CheY-like chemotaxis protein/tetratricopeptide (TPR) repeat protein
MRLETALLHQITDPNLSRNERALLRCQLARHKEESGDYEAAREALSELWYRVGERPLLEGLDEEVKAQVLLRVGALTGWIGSAKQIEGAQETAKDLINESSRIFLGLNTQIKVAEAQTDLAVCYWREGAFDEARVVLQEALTCVGDIDNETKAVALLRSAIVEMSARRFHDALRIDTEAAPLFDGISNHLLQAKFHNTFANVLNFLSLTEAREDYIDRALIEYTAASFHFEQAGHGRYQGCVENNLGFLLSTIGRFDDAHEHLDRAQVLLTRLQDELHLAQVDQTRARVMLAEGRVVEAEKTVRNAVRTLEKGDELSLLAEALTTQGIALARLDHAENARTALKRAAEVAEQAGDFESAGVAALTLIEQLGQDFSGDDASATIGRAEILLEKTQDLAIVRRLAKAALRALRVILIPPDWTNFSLQRVVDRYEAHWIKLALQETGSLVTKAARLLGFKHHQSLISLINLRHKDLLKTRSVVRRRRHHLIFHPKRAAKKRAGLVRSQGASRLSILHVEDNATVAKLVQESLELEGWQVETCAEGNTAVEKITSDAHYDLLLLDYDLPGVNGVQLIQHARSLPHHRKTPIIILSAALDETAARVAGADALLRKPEDISGVAAAIRGLVSSVKE